MVIKLFYHGHKCTDIAVDAFDAFGFDDVFSDAVYYGCVNGMIVCWFPESQYDVVKTDYGFEVNKVV